MFGEREYKSRVNTAEANSLNIKANICGGFGLQPLHISRIIVMEHGHVFSWQWQDEENQREPQRGGGGWQEVASLATADELFCSSLGNRPLEMCHRSSASCCSELLVHSETVLWLE